MKQSKKTTFQIMYETVMENGGPTGPLSKAVVDAFEGKNQFQQRENKIIVSFIKTKNKLSTD
ncbi:hypothetical protein [Candidatus Pelagibacter sp. HIMB109]|uniref:hypothetical protein n=1 Tax=Candidatus Pelagibacter sp. HIMB109 TaxID=3415412 RepID=UPI003F84D04D